MECSNEELFFKYFHQLSYSIAGFPNLVQLNNINCKSPLPWST